MKRRRRDRSEGARGSILVLALLMSSAASIAGMWLVLTSDLKVRANRYLVRAADASRVGSSGLQLARVKLGENAAWGGAAYSDPDHPQETLAVTSAAIGVMISHVTSVGAVKDATQTVGADLRAVAHPTLAYNYVAADEIEFDNATLGGYVRGNDDVTAEGDVDFTGVIETVQGAHVTSEIDPDQVHFVADELALPNVKLGTYLAASSALFGLPFDSGRDAYVLDKRSLTPSSNPYGATNPYGAYKIDANSKDLVLRDVYISGTLTVTNVRKVIIERGYHHLRAFAFLASLLVDGDVEMHLETTMSELLMARDINLDGDLLDTFTPRFEGLAYVTDDFRGPYGGTIRGTIMAEDLTLVGTSATNSDPLLVTQPVIEFTQPGAWSIVAGSIAGS